jgi:hypothetical protein
VQTAIQKNVFHSVEWGTLGMCLWKQGASGSTKFGNQKYQGEGRKCIFVDSKDTKVFQMKNLAFLYNKSLICSVEKANKCLHVLIFHVLGTPGREQNFNDRAQQLQQFSTRAAKTARMVAAGGSSGNKKLAESLLSSASQVCS